MSSRSWFIVIGVILLGGLGYLAYARNKSEKEIGRPKSASELPTIAVPEDIDKLSIKEGTKEEILLEKKGDKWMLVKPVAALANQQAVKDVVANLKDLKIDRQVDLKLDDAVKKEKKLDGEALRVVAFKGADKKGEFVFGNNNLIQVADKPNDVFAAKGFSSYLYTKETRAWRDNEIWKFDDANANQIMIKNKHGEYSFTKGDKGWAGTFKGKPIERFEEQKVKDVLLDLKSIHADDFADGKPVSETGMDNPEATITIALKDNAGKYGLKLGKNPGGGTHFASKDGENTVYILSKIASDWIVGDVYKFQRPADAGAPDAAAGDAAAGGIPPVKLQIPGPGKNGLPQ